MTRPLWVDPGERRFPTLEGNVEVDVAIVGAGFSGLGAAWALRDAGASVAVLEARSVASGASGRNAGFIVAGPSMGFRDAAHLAGEDETLAIWSLTRRNHATLAGIIEDLGLDCGYIRRGSMALAAGDDEWEDMLADLGAMLAAGIDVCRVERQDLPVPFDRMYRGGIYCPGNAEIQPAQFLRGVARYLTSRISIFEGTAVEAMAYDERWTLTAPSGVVRATHVVVATNAYTAGLLSQPIAPTRGQVLATEPVDRVVVPFPMGANRGFQYWRQTSDGRLVIGGWRDLDFPTEVGEVEDLNANIHEALDRFAAEVHRPSPRVTHRWAGIMGFTPDRMPLVGLVPATDAMAIAAGYSGHGVAMAFQCGVLAAGAVLGGTPEIPAAFAPERFM